MVVVCKRAFPSINQTDDVSVYMATEWMAILPAKTLMSVNSGHQSALRNVSMRKDHTNVNAFLDTTQKYSPMDNISVKVLVSKLFTLHLDSACIGQCVLLSLKNATTLICDCRREGLAVVCQPARHQKVGGGWYDSAASGERLAKCHRCWLWLLQQTGVLVRQSRGKNYEVSIGQCSFTVNTWNIMNKSKKKF